MIGTSAHPLLTHEATGLLCRISQLRPFALRISTVAAAAVSPSTLEAVEQHVERGAVELRQRVLGFLSWLRAAEPGSAPLAEEGQRRLTLLRLRFNAVLSELDVFADALGQRSEHGLGTWLAGLDALATDALLFPGVPYQAPPLMCYVDRGLGAAVRRARTRLSTGRSNPVTIVRVPRERMIGAGVASSLVHEVGHQAAALMDLVASLRPVLRAFATSPGNGPVWRLWDRWSSEILADFWSVARVGISAPLGLLAVVSLPAPFVFRINADDPHPTPWIRVKLSCAIGAALYPHPQWAALATTWERLYPRRSLSPDTRQLIAGLEASMPALVAVIAQHRPRALGGRSLAELLADPARAPDRLSRLGLTRLEQLPPTLAFALMGNARIAGNLSAEREAQLIASLLTRWALHRSRPPPLATLHRFAVHAAVH